MNLDVLVSEEVGSISCSSRYRCTHHCTLELVMVRVLLISSKWENSSHVLNKILVSYTHLSQLLLKLYVCVCVCVRKANISILYNMSVAFGFTDLVSSGQETGIPFVLKQSWAVT